MKHSRSLRIATRKSQLALWQTQYVADQLTAHHPELDLEFIEINTRGDQIQDHPLRDVGGKALFVKGLEQALLRDQADIAVHSMKDVPSQIDATLSLPAICKRGNPFDALVSNQYTSIDALPQGAVIGSSSPRRQAQLRAYRADLTLINLRGNVNTRLAKLDAREFDAIILACAGLERLGLTHRITQQLPPTICLPASSQGAIGIETLASRKDLHTLLQPLNDLKTHQCIDIERTICAQLDGDCHSPIAVYCEQQQAQFIAKARVCKPDGSQVIESSSENHAHQQVITHITAALFQQGCKHILQR